MTACKREKILVYVQNHLARAAFVMHSYKGVTSWEKTLVNKKCLNYKFENKEIIK